MQKDVILRLAALANAGSISLPEFFKVLRKEKALQVRVELVRMRMLFSGEQHSIITGLSAILDGISIHEPPELGAVLQALERSRLDRISFADFVIRVARSGFSTITIFVRRNYISFEGRHGLGFSVPAIIKPVRRDKNPRRKKDAGPR